MKHVNVCITVSADTTRNARLIAGALVRHIDECVSFQDFINDVDIDQYAEIMWDDKADELANNT